MSPVLFKILKLTKFTMGGRITKDILSRSIIMWVLIPLNCNEETSLPFVHKATLPYHPFNKKNDVSIFPDYTQNPSPMIRPLAIEQKEK